MVRLHVVVGLVWVVASASACSSDDAAAGGRIGPAGGDLDGPDGAKLSVPTGALAADAALKIAVATTGYSPLPAGTQAHGKVFAFTPHGQTFSAPVQISVPFTTAGSANALLSSDPGGVWTTVAGASATGTALAANVSHFSFFVVAEQSGSAGPIDGTWLLATKVCDSVPVDMTSWPATNFTFANTTGSIVNSACTIPVSLSYPGPATVEWVIGQNNCGGSGDKHSADFVVQGDTLTLTEALTPADEFGCPSGAQVSTLTKQ